MICRSRLWIAAVAVSSAATSTLSVAVTEPDAGWTITIDEPAAEAVVESKHLTIEGTASNEAGLDGVTVTIVPQGLPPQCGPETGPATVDGGGGYVIELDVRCNGPYQIEVVADGPSGSATGGPRTVGVAEQAPQPAPPEMDVTAEGGLRATWDPGDEPDADGTILLVNFREDLFGPGIGEATLPPTDRRAAVAVRALRWGALGPGTTISSPESNWISIAEIRPTDPTGPADPTEPPPSERPVTPPAPPPAGEPSSSLPSPTGGGSSAPSTTVPAGPSEAQPGAAMWPEPDRHPSSDAEERAVSTAPAGGLVRTRDERPPGLVVLVALALLIIAVPIAWHTRRTHSRS